MDGRHDRDVGPTAVADLLDRHGTTAVVPGDDPSACARAGLEPFDPSRGDGATLDDQRTVDSLSSRLVQSFLDVCLDEPASRAAAEAALDDEGLDDWSVVVTVPFSTQRRCGDAERRRRRTDDRDRGDPTSARRRRLMPELDAARSVENTYNHVLN